MGVDLRVALVVQGDALHGAALHAGAALDAGLFVVVELVVAHVGAQVGLGVDLGRQGLVELEVAAALHVARADDLGGLAVVRLDHEAGLGVVADDRQRLLLGDGPGHAGLHKVVGLVAQDQAGLERVAAGVERGLGDLGRAEVGHVLAGTVGGAGLAVAGGEGEVLLGVDDRLPVVIGMDLAVGHDGAVAGNGTVERGAAVHEAVAGVGGGGAHVHEVAAGIGGHVGHGVLARALQEGNLAVDLLARMHGAEHHAAHRQGLEQLGALLHGAAALGGKVERVEEDALGHLEVGLGLVLVEEAHPEAEARVGEVTAHADAVGVRQRAQLHVHVGDHGAVGAHVVLGLGVHELLAATVELVE